MCRQMCFAMKSEREENLFFPTEEQKKKEKSLDDSPGWIEFPLVFKSISSKINNLLYAFNRMVVVDCDRLNA